MSNPIRAGNRKQILGLILLLWLAIFGLFILQGGRLALLYLVGVSLGAVLLLGAVSFTSAYRRLFLYRDISGVSAQLLMLLIASIIFTPLLIQGDILGQPVSGALAPVGGSVVVGAFAFGVGMQLAGGCGSGTLYLAGSGHPRMILVLLCFCFGGFWASLDMHWWQDWPSIPAISLIHDFEGGRGLAGQCALFMMLFGLLHFLPGRRSDSLPATLVVVVIFLALLNAVTLILAGHPWSITWGFTLWAGKLAALLGWEPSLSPFWSGAFQIRALQNSIFSDVTSVMNMGVLSGALLAGRISKQLSDHTAQVKEASIGPVIAAIIGGLLLGYGARIAYGCNIGAMFSGIASGSLHGWVWLLAVLPGNWLGVKLRPLFGLSNE